jgi:hypothetical protein
MKKREKDESHSAWELSGSLWDFRQHGHSLVDSHGKFFYTPLRRRIKEEMWPIIMRNVREHTSITTPNTDIRWHRCGSAFRGVKLAWDVDSASTRHPVCSHKLLYLCSSWIFWPIENDLL